MVESPENKKIDTSTIHETLWKCRDFEISHLWQRSIFLTAFLVLFFTAYGILISKVFDNMDNMKSIIPHLAGGYLLSILGTIFSILWIKMGKGSKAWYENYERAIIAFEQNEKYATRLAAEIGGFSYNKLEKYDNANLHPSIFSTQAGAYSVSRVNIMIGQFFLVTWWFIGISHAFATFVTVRKFSLINCEFSCFLLLMCFLILGALSYWFGKSSTLKSKTLDNL